MGGGRLRGFMAKLRRDVRALSPIFAVLLLIAIAVIAGIIIYMYTSGYLSTMMGGGTAGQEKVAIQTVRVGAVAGSTQDVILYCKSTGGGPVYITDAILKNAAGQTIEVVSGAEVVVLAGTFAYLPADGTLGTVTCTFAAANLVAGQSYTVSLVSQAGNQFVSGAFKA